jgi:DNA replication factor GINS
MDLDELRSVQRTEREKSQLQHLRDSFYRDVATYVETRKDEYRSRLANADDPFAASEDAEHIKDEVETAQQVVEALYERRVGKVVKMAAFAAAGMGANEEGLTAEERSLFDDLVARIQRNRETVLDRVGGDTGGGSGGESGTDTSAAESAGDGRHPDASPEAPTTGPPGPGSGTGTDDPAPADEYAPDVVGDASPTAEATPGEDQTPAEPSAPVEGAPEGASGGGVLSEAMGGAGGTDTEGVGGNPADPDPDPDPDHGSTTDADVETDPGTGTGEHGQSVPGPGPGAGESEDGSGPGSARPDSEADAGPASTESGADPASTRVGTAATETPGVGDGDGNGAPGVDVGDDPLSADATDAAGPADPPAGDGSDGSDVREVTAADLDPSAPGVTATGGAVTGDRAAGASDGRSDGTAGTDPVAGGDPERVTVRVTGRVGEVYGVDGRAYDLAPEDVVTLPADNAAPLLDAGAAERLE